MALSSEQALLNLQLFLIIKVRYALNDRIMILLLFQRHTKLKKKCFYFIVMVLLWCFSKPNNPLPHIHTHTHSKKIIHLKFIKYIYKIVSKKWKLFNLSYKFNSIKHKKYEEPWTTILNRHPDVFFLLLFLTGTFVDLCAASLTDCSYV